MKVFGIGLQRTGTKTLGRCLKHFGFNHLSFRRELFNQFMRGELARVWEAAEHFDSFEDWPWPCLYKCVDHRYPDSKFILTVRQDSETWFRSLMRLAEITGPSEGRAYFYGHAMPHGHRAEHIAAYEAHNREVLRYFEGRPGKLLVVCWEEGSGWEALGGFLERAVPSVPFPHENKSPGPWRRLRRRLGAYYRSLRSP